MSGDAQISERISISPPVTWGELHDKPWATSGRGESGEWPDVVVELATTEEHGPAGVTKQISGVAIIPTGHETSAYTLLDDVNRIVRVFGVAPDGKRRTFAGFLHVIWGHGESVYRVVVLREGTAVQIEPQIVWPAGARDEDSVEPKSRWS